MSQAELDQRDALLAASVAALTALDLARAAVAHEMRDLLTNRLPLDATPARTKLVLSLLARACNHHAPCRPTCFKYDKNKCRFRFPRPLFAQTSFDDHHFSLNVRRDEASTLLNGFNEMVLLATRANHDLRSILFSTTGPSFAFYITKYISKPSGVQLAHNAAVQAASAIARRRERRADDSDAVRTASGVLLSLVSKSVSEVSAAAAVYAAINHVRASGDCYCS